MFCVCSEWGPFLEIWTDVRAKRKCYILYWWCSVVFNMLLSHNLSRLLYMSGFFLRFLQAILMSSSEHEIIIPRTSLLGLHRNIVCISKQRTCYLIRCLHRLFFTLICLYDYQAQMVEIGEKERVCSLCMSLSPCTMNWLLKTVRN